jgi:hypothetical protein
LEKEAYVATDQVILMLSRFFLGAVATFLAIMLWSRTRDTAWMLIVIGTIAHYGDVVFNALETFGVVRLDVITIGSVAVFPLVLTNLPTLFFILAFLVMVVRKVP